MLVRFERGIMNVRVEMVRVGRLLEKIMEDAGVEVYMENKKVEMMIDGKKYEVVIGKEIKEEAKRTGYERVEDLAENIARADELYRRLRRFAVTENAKTEAVSWGDGGRIKHHVLYDYENKDIKIVDHYFTRVFGSIYFLAYESAEKAMEEFKDELIWYFTEFKDHL